MRASDPRVATRRRAAGLARVSLIALFNLAGGACGNAAARPEAEAGGIDLAALGEDALRRVYGSRGNGILGLPVAGGADVDGDGFLDTAFASMQATPNLVPQAGEIYLVFGDGTLHGALDTAREDPRILRIRGAVPYEYAGSELWLDDVTGDGLGDVLIGRQNYTGWSGEAGERSAAGALSVLVGSPSLRGLSQRLEAIELGRPSPDVNVLTLVGAEAHGRLGIWVRSGDVTGDAISDIVVGADQDSMLAEHAGAAYVLAGGPWLTTTATLDLAAAATAPLAGYVARLTAPAEPMPARYHFGATCQIADLDGNGRGEVLVAAALNRAGAILDVMGGMTATASGGPPHGNLFIAWDDNFPPLPWPAPFELGVGRGAGSHTLLAGGANNVSFGEELVGGVDWDQDGSPDLFVGDLAANLPGRPSTGMSHIIYAAAGLKGVTSDISQLSRQDPPLRTTTIYGAAAGDISGDTAAEGDFSGDGVPDLALCSPHSSPLRRAFAGSIQLLLGRAGGWPAEIDLRAPPDAARLERVPIYGAHGNFGLDRGDTLCYSAAAADLDADGLTDLISNEMVGNGLAPGSVDVGNLILLGGALMTR